jgi:hypothetical protein
MNSRINPYYQGNWIITSNTGWHLKIFLVSETIAVEKLYQMIFESKQTECLQLWNENYNQWDLKRLIYISNYENN